MKELIEKLKVEEKELNVKIEKLTEFILSNKFNEIEEKHQLLLRSQATAMATYDNILIARIIDLEGN